jgi:hypothetical protein
MVVRNVVFIAFSFIFERYSTDLLAEKIKPESFELFSEL